jgi:predicted small secreted protein
MIRKLLFVPLALGSLLLAGCPDDGPLEEAGETIDEGLEDTGEALEDAAEEIEDEVDDPQ